ncbi:hypothetical protein Cgig2_015200 [Carnegiea gigantea]|uniref:TF-B3 domain-containing protein n=1 Tax=Carnegiea gigantea TaxID=171969 RepID=A0A9Q1QML5_9CARY|nr:hypothetical protein Cgig2_015200 [Carnegiea gigantea]
MVLQCIPSAFIANFNGNIPKKCKLRDSQGKFWYVELKEIGRKLLMCKGWECFVSGHSLVRGDFLIFQYNGNGLFIVNIFGLNGCKKDETTVTSHQLEMKVEEEARSEHIASDHTGTCELNHSERGMVVDNRHPAGIIDGHKINPPEVNLPENIRLRNQRGDYLPVKFRRRADRRVEVARGWRNFCLDNHIYQGDELEFEIILGKQRKVREIVLLQVNHKRRHRTSIAR